MFNPSPQQSRIFESLASPTGPNLIVDAAAGTGKSTTIKEGLAYIPMVNEYIKPAVAVIMFNKAVADAMRPKVPAWVQVGTGHAFGLRALKASGFVARNVEVKGTKCHKLVWNACDRDDPDTKAIIKLVSLCKGMPTEHPDKEVLRAAAFHYDLQLEDTEKAIRIALAVLETSNRNMDTLDFDDMLYLAVIRNAKFDIQDYLFVDEAQDTNDIQLEIFSRMLGPKSRIIAVGDPHQAIYGFRGANADSMKRIQQRFSCETLPLSVSYRCSKAVVAEARKYVKA